MTITTDFVKEDLLLADTMDELRANSIMLNLINANNFPDNSQTITKRKGDTFEFETVAEAGNTSIATYTETSVSVTAVKGAKNTQLSHEAMRFRTAGNFGTLGREAGRAAATWIDLQIMALLSGFSQSVGSTGVDLTVAVFRQAAALLELASVPGPWIAVLHAVQKQDIQADLLASDKSPYVSQVELNILGGTSPLANGFNGTLFDIPVFSSLNNPTANAGADRVGIIWNPERAVLAGFDPQIYTMGAQNPGNLTEQRAFAVYAGFAELEDISGVKIVTDA